MTESNNLLRRYTDVTSLLHMLTHKEITLLDPATWDDKNDSEYLESYKKKNKLKSLLALCFTEAPETHHHWKVYSPGNSGVCIRFDKTALLRCVDRNRNVIHESVTYKTIDELENISPKIEALPFLKRFPFRDEEEYRLIYTSKETQHKLKDIAIDLSSIERIVLSPSLHKSLAATLRATIKTIDGCKDIRIHRTTLNESKRWIACGKNAI